MGEQGYVGDREETEGTVCDKINELERIATYDGKDKVVPWVDFLKEKEASSSKADIIQTGFFELDSALKGLKTGEVVVMSGITGNGKTLFAKSIIRNLSLADVHCTCLSYEVSTEEFLTAFHANSLFDAKIFVPKEMRVGAVQWVYKKALEAKLKFNSKIIMIDHLHYIIDMNTDKMTVNVGACMRRLKQMAVELNVVVILIAHQEKLKDDKEPGIETLRDSSFVGQEADDVIIVHRIPDDAKMKGNERTYEKGYALVKIDKARRAGTFRKRLTFQKQGDWLEPL